MQSEGLRKRHASPFMSQAFKPCAWLANIDFIKRLIATNHLMMVVMSDSNGGKSTFVDLMRLKFEPAIQTIFIQTEPDESEAMLLKTACTIFNVSSNEGINTFDSFFENLPVPKQPVLLVIDDAQQLSLDCLRQLVFAYKQHAFTKRFYLCLVSDFTLSPHLHRFEQEGLKNFIHTIEPGALTEAETKTYVLRYAQGQQGLEALLTPERFKAFYALTQGQIAAIHQQLKILSQVQSKGKTASKKKRTYRNSFAMILALVMIGISVKQHMPGKTVSAIPIADSASLVSYISPWHLNGEMLAIEPPPLQKYAKMDLEEEEQTNEKLVMVDKVVVIPTLHHSVALEQKHISKLVAAPVFASLAPHQATNQVVFQKTGYTIQLMAAKKVEIISHFIRTHHLDKQQVQIRQVLREKDRWYVLTMGAYPQLSQAQLAAQHLPHKLKQLKPWIRTDAMLEAVG
jgi:DamX protein